MDKMPFRQIHLDFHTSECIPGIGENFNKKEFQEALQAGFVDSINIFAKCHHGHMYYKGAVPEHPHLTCDLTTEMVDACKEIGVKTQVYVSAGLDEVMAKKHPEWLFRTKDQSTTWARDFNNAGYHQLCMNTDYLDYLLNQIRDTAKKFDTDAIWLDIVGVRECYCQTCINQLVAEGKDPRNHEDIKELGEKTYKKYLTSVKDAIHEVKPGMGVFHNGGHIIRGRRDLFAFNTNQELESLPTGGWGYDHFPLSARYVQNKGKEFVGMTGKFHTTWGEFGGFKHPNALRYEAALNLANGAKISIGDQMHPDGQLDLVTYKLIGKAYKEVSEKEKWCSDVTNVADIGVLSQECVLAENTASGEIKNAGAGDKGAIRILLESKFLFDVIDKEDTFDNYKVLILPDSITLNDDLCKKIKGYIKGGGKILASGTSGLNVAQTEFSLDFGAKYKGLNKYRPDYYIPDFSYLDLGTTSFIIYSQGYNIECTNGTVLAKRENPYFNRDLLHFSSHFHTVNQKGKDEAGVILGNDGIYISWDIFDDYAHKGSLIVKKMVTHYLDMLLADNKTLSTNLPAQGIVTVQHQELKKRYVNHVLYASPIKRGENIEVIEDILPIYNTNVCIRVAHPIKKVYLAPQMEDIPFTTKNGIVSYTIKEFECHQMVVLEY